MDLLLYIGVLTGTFVVFADAESYCDMKSCGSKTHTRCLYPTLEVSKQCGKVKSSGLTQNEINDILKTHNDLRARVASGQEKRGNPGPQPAATNLGDMKWDQEVADIAQTWANQCKFGHDDCRNTARFSVGQNIAYEASTGTNDVTPSQLVQLWYDEVKDFNRNGVKSYSFEEKTGHYTQLVWAKSTYLGCGFIRYNADDKWNAAYLVCNYGPAGNVIGQAIYNIR